MPFYNSSNILAFIRLVKTAHVTQYAPTKIEEYPSDIPQVIFPSFQNSSLKYDASLKELRRGNVLLLFQRKI